MNNQRENWKPADRNASALEQALRQAAAALQNGQAQNAERIVRDVLVRHPREPGALQLLGMTLLAQERAREAVAPLEEAAGRRPGAAVETYWAIALRKTGRSAAALGLLQRAIERQPPLPHAFYELGSLLYEQRRPDEAQAMLERGLRAAPGVAEFSMTLGNIFLDRGDAKNAELAFSRALASAPGHPEVLRGFGCALMGTGEFERASERFRQVLARDPSDARSQLLLASCLLEIGKADEAITHLRAVVRKSPQLFGEALKAFVQVGRGRLWLKPSAAAEFLRPS